MTESSKSTNQTQSSQTNPWAPAVPLLNTLIDKYKGQNVDVTGGQQSALDNLSGAVSGIPQFGDRGASAISNLFSSSTRPQVGMLTTAFDTLKQNLGGTASGSELDPYKTPGFGDALSATMADITNRVKSTYAGSGRDPSGAGSFAGSLSRGLTQGVAPLLQSQFNTNKQNQMNAAGTLFGGANSTATGITGLDQTQLQNGIAGITGAGALPGLFASPATAQLGAANAQFGQPFANLAQLLQPSVSLAGLGNTSSGQISGTSTSTPSLLDSLMSGTKLGGSWMSGIGSLFALSDERAKEDIEPVGKTFDGQNLYSFRYKGEETPHVGLLAQEREKIDPDSVVEVGGLKVVNYGRALHRSRMMGSGRVGVLKEAA